MNVSFFVENSKIQMEYVNISFNNLSNLMLNGFNYFEYLLLMFLRIKQYGVVSRDCRIQLFRETSEECVCKYCRKVLSITSEL